MHVITARNVNHAYAQGVDLISRLGHTRSSRNGDVLVMGEPVTTHYQRPTERVLFDKQRNANPFFHLFEAMWMLAGHNDVAFPAYLVPRMAEYSDNGEKFHGAYGFRWRHHFVYDQLQEVIDMLRKDPTNRRVILSMWDARCDLGTNSKDIPCNIVAKFAIEHRVTKPAKLNMVVFNRSNDIVWGAYGANAVHFSVLQEFIAASLEVEVGWYEQVSTDYHVYHTQWLKVLKGFPKGQLQEDAQRYEMNQVKPFPLVSNADSFTDDCAYMIHQMETGYVNAIFHNEFFIHIATPMANAFVAYRNDNIGEAIAQLEAAIDSTTKPHGPKNDWLVAGLEWMERINDKRTGVSRR